MRAERRLLVHRDPEAQLQAVLPVAAARGRAAAHRRGVPEHQGLAEAVHFAKTAGLDTEAVLEAVSKGAAQSWQMDNRWKTMVQGKFDFGFAVDWMRKDLGLVLDEARSNGATLSLTALVDQYYADLQKMGGRRWDTSSLAARLEKP